MGNKRRRLQRQRARLQRQRARLSQQRQSKIHLALANGVPGWMCKRELGIIYKQASAVPPGSTYVEIGTWKGRSLMAAGLAIPPTSRIVGVDTFYGDDTGAHTITKYAPEYIELCAKAVIEYLRMKREIFADLVNGTSTTAALLFLDESVDAVFIDAAHDEKSVTHDLNTWWPKIKPGGVMYGHDYCAAQKGVLKAVKKFAKSIDTEHIVIRSTTIWKIFKSP